LATTTAGGGYGGGVGGVGGSVPRCVPGQSIGCTCSTGQLGAQVCQPNGTYGPCMCEGPDSGTWEQQQLERLRRGIVGTWSGVQTNPWFPSCPTTFVFEASGHYSAHSPGDSCIVLYYGSNDDSPEKTYLLDDVLADGDGHGTIVFWFGAGDANMGEIRHLSLSADENELSFEVWNGQYGPIVFTLKRVSL
jgi:hypothetical protein